MTRSLCDCPYRYGTSRGNVCLSPRVNGYPQNLVPPATCERCCALAHMGYFAMSDKPRPAPTEAELAAYVPPAPLANQADCRHRSAEPARSEECPTCSGSVRVKVFLCAIHGECQLAAKIDGLKACDGTCADYVSGS